MRLRRTTSSDRDLLDRLLVEAFNWTGEARVTLAQVRTDPELGMAVLAAFRGQGVGALLLDACLVQIREAGHTAVSLSVEDGNSVARRLYESRGFRAVARNGDSDTLLLTL